MSGSDGDFWRFIDLIKAQAQNTADNANRRNTENLGKPVIPLQDPELAYVSTDSPPNTCP
jgi:hypothetical protein